MQHDASGDVTYDGRNSYLYNAEGQICAVSNTYNSITTMIGYVYDADGQRVAKGTITTFSCDVTVNGFQTQSDYVRDQAGNQLSEFTPGSGGSVTLAHTNVWADGVLIATDDVNKTHYYLNDWLGTRRVQTDYAGTLEQSCASLPYGDGETCGPAPTENLYTGKERDSESGNDYFGARYYASTVGRFLSPDLLGGKMDDPQSLNRYAYVRDNPLRYTDLTGMNFGLPCSGGNSAGCNNGLQGSWQTDASGKKEFVDVSIGNQDGKLMDVSANKTGAYTASFDGKNVLLTNSAGKTLDGSWLQGTAEVKGISGGGPLSNKFSFNFSDHGNGQKLHAMFTYTGSYSDLKKELEAAGYQYYLRDAFFDLREDASHPFAASFRTPGDKGTGANSGHFLVDHAPWATIPTTGSMHTGETNPYASAGAAMQHLEHEQ